MSLFGVARTCTLLRLVRAGSVYSGRLLFLLLTVPTMAMAQQPEGVTHRPGGEASLILPDMGQVTFSGIPGRTLLFGGLIVCIVGMLFGLLIYRKLKAMPVHSSMAEVSELIYETCKTYLMTQ